MSLDQHMRISHLGMKRCTRCREFKASVRPVKVSAFDGDSLAVTARLCLPCVDKTRAGKAVVEAVR